MPCDIRFSQAAMGSTDVFRITFVCTGNTCRSPMAEAVARRLVADRGMSGVTVDSAGTHAGPGRPASEGARAVATAAGLDLEAHRSRLLTEDRVAESDLLLCMTAGHLRHAEALGGAGRSRLLAEMAGEGGDVHDPFGGSTEVYAAVLEEIARLVDAVLTAGVDVGEFGGEERAGGLGAAVPDPGDLAAAPTFAVLGDPVAHSLSPAIHTAAFRAAGIRARYVAWRVSAGECGPLLRSIALAGGGGNVTLPHKERVLPFLDRRTEAVEATGACNTFWAQDGQVWGDNTDVEGFDAVWSMGAAAGAPASALVLGAGGAARAVLLALLGARSPSASGPSPGPLAVTLWNRTRARAKALARHFADDRLSAIAEWRGASPDVVVNATSVGLDGRSSPIDLNELGASPGAVIDLVYGTEVTPLCRQARDLGVPFVDGREMLVRQAEAAYRRWFGEAPPKGAMARALE